MRISAYVSIFDDWNLLKPALRTIEDLVDEIVVVDGAYRWITPYLSANGRDPSRSRTEVYDVLASFGRKVRTVNNLWENESEKRAAGYEACSGRYVVRSDADEIVFWDDPNLQRFFASDKAVGQMEMPLYVAPGKIRADPTGAALERQSFVFDKQKISSREHLSYLWLVVPPSERAHMAPASADIIYPIPLAFTAHLTHWRQPETAIARARFYVLNYIRTTGSVPWLPDYKFFEDISFARFLEIIPQEVFHDYLLGHPIVAAPPDMQGKVIRSSPCSTRDDRSFAILYDVMIAALKSLNDRLAWQSRFLICGVAYYFDATKTESLSALQDGATLRLRFSHPVAAAQLTMQMMFSDGRVEQTELAPVVAQQDLSCDIPAAPSAEVGVLRRTLALSVWADTTDHYIRFRANAKGDHAEF